MKRFIFPLMLAALMLSAATTAKATAFRPEMDFSGGPPPEVTVTTATKTTTIVNDFFILPAYGLQMTAEQDYVFTVSDEKATSAAAVSAIKGEEEVFRLCTQNGNYLIGGPDGCTVTNFHNCTTGFETNNTRRIYEGYISTSSANDVEPETITCDNIRMTAYTERKPAYEFKQYPKPQANPATVRRE